MAAFVVISAFSAAPALAATGMAHPWQFGYQKAESPVMESITSFHSMLVVIITAIVLFVLALILYSAVRFNKKANPIPSKTSHNTLIEVAWTIIPILILVVIAIPSFRLLYLEETIPDADVTVKATGYQWYWGYSYPDEGIEEFSAVMLEDNELKDGQPRLLSVDNEVVVPAGKVVRVIVTAADVIHSFAVPSFGIKVDAVPGRLNETWFQAKEPGIYYGQCSELCGQRHAYMPIAIRAVTEEQYAAWKAKAVDDLEGANATLAAELKTDRTVASLDKVAAPAGSSD
ncbi:MAG: cytochrome c oxidase subunit II [Rhodobiaceae bacterium]|nr:cytochrome c oxidase subunit II [Rhodobiaceae bacterium]